MNILMFYLVRDSYVDEFEHSPLYVTRKAFQYWEAVPGHSCRLPSDFRSLGTAGLPKLPPASPTPGHKFSSTFSRKRMKLPSSDLLEKVSLLSWKLE